MTYTQRGKLIVFEGIDGCGKSTHARILAERIGAVLIGFPARTTPIGTLLDSYLRGNIQLDPHCAHLLFCANRWELAQYLKDLLDSGQDVVCDRYTISGAVYAHINGIDREWACAPEMGLAPADFTLYLERPIIENSSTRIERFESLDMQWAAHCEFEKYAHKFAARIDTRPPIDIVAAQIYSVCVDRLTLNK